MNLKRIIGSHFANYRESWEANRLIAKGMIHPMLSQTYPLEEIGQAALDVHRNAHQGKVGVLCLAPEEGLGVRDGELRAKHEQAINRFRGVDSSPGRTAAGRNHPRPAQEPEGGVGYPGRSWRLGQCGPTATSPEGVTLHD